MKLTRFSLTCLWFFGTYQRAPMPYLSAMTRTSMEVFAFPEVSMLKRRDVRFLTVIGLWLFVLAACNDATSSTDPRTQPPLVRIEAVEISVQSERLFTGIVAARVQSDLGFRVPGKVLERLVDAGQPVKRGQSLMRIDPTDLRLAMRAHEEAVAAARARAHQTAEDELRHRNLIYPGAVSASEYDKAKAGAESARAELNAAEAQAGVARNEMSYAVRFADADGVVVESLAEPGQVVAAGQVVVRVAHAGLLEAVVELLAPLRVSANSRWAIASWRSVRISCTKASACDLRKTRLHEAWPSTAGGRDEPLQPLRCRRTRARRHPVPARGDLHRWRGGISDVGPGGRSLFHDQANDRRDGMAGGHGQGDGRASR